MLYEVDTIIWNLLRKWIHESLQKGKEALQNAKEIETWNPKSKTEPIAQSTVELVKLAMTIMEQFFSRIQLELMQILFKNLPMD
ncbi:hypothetical protein Ahy_A02g007273 [Arachis hypogaea]|uniref:MHD1 domain-containing protein n=1 Tax=Arachis hypogaea TaxID=3818 RepID=A0A445EBV7_ARAHY|nr:hypothetical protein Ahy_A02g007273 [Arachis hypogaea]